MSDHDLTNRQRQYVENVARGMASRAAAKAAGYSETFAKVSAYRLLKKPAIAEAIAEIRKAAMKAAVYDLATAMEEARQVCEFAKAHKNPMAYAKGVELRSRLTGLLVERVEVATVDLKGALDLAQNRVLKIVNAQRIDESDPGESPAGSA